MKTKGVLLCCLLHLVSCVQKEVGITYKDIKNGEELYKPSYMRGGYVKDGKNGVVRDLRIEKDAKEDAAESNIEEDNIVEEKKVEKKQNTEAVTIIVQQGDTLLKYQREYGVSVEEIAKMNKIKKPYNIYVGQKLKIKASSKNAINNNKTKLKTIKIESGDSLLKLSIKYNTNIRELAEINNISAPYNIYAGQILKVPDASATNKKIAVTNKGNGDTYTVEKGDSLLLIAKKTNTKFNDLIRINNLKRPYSVYVGQKIRLNDSGVKEKVKVEEETVEKVEHNTENNNAKPINNVVVKSANNNFMKPIEGVIIKNFGDNSDGKFFDGILIKGNKGDAVHVAEDGEIAYVGNELKDLGNIVIVKHKNNWLSIYGYCDTTNVKTKDIVKRGDVIASVGKTGSAVDYQLYFAIRRGKVAVDPVKYLSNN